MKHVTEHKPKLWNFTYSQIMSCKKHAYWCHFIFSTVLQPNNPGMLIVALFFYIWLLVRPWSLLWLLSHHRAD